MAATMPVRGRAEVCAELDDAVVACVEALQRYLDLQVVISDAFKRGHLNLARTRTAASMPGPFSDKFPSELEATALVRVFETSSGGLELSVAARPADGAAADAKPTARTTPGASLPPIGGAHLDAATPGPNSVGVLVGNMCTFEDERGVNHVSSVQSNVRFAPGGVSGVQAATFAALVAEGTAREAAAAGGGGDSGGRAQSSLDTPVIDAPRVRAPPRQHDPIKWFGVLVPPPLRDAQRVFERALPTTLELAAASLAVAAARERVEALTRERDLTDQPGAQPGAADGAEA